VTASKACHQIESRASDNESGGREFELSARATLRFCMNSWPAIRECRTEPRVRRSKPPTQVVVNEGPQLSALSP